MSVGRIGLDRIEMVLMRLRGMERVRNGKEWIGNGDRVNMDWIGLDRIGSDRIGSDRIDFF